MKSLVGLIMFAGFALAAPAGHRLLGAIPIGGEGGWDYATIDSAARRLYVSHATKVVVVDVDTNKIVGEIPETLGVHGIAIASKLGRGYISNGRTNDVTVFDLATLKTLARVPAGSNPDAIVYDASSNRVFAFNGRSKNASAIDTATDKVIATIPLGGKPEFAVCDGKGKLFVNIEDTHEVVELNTKALTLTKRCTLTGCDEPSGLAQDLSKRRLFSVCGNKVMVVSDPDAGKVVQTLPIGDGADAAAFDASTRLAYSSNGDGTLTVVGEAAGKYTVVETKPTQRSARTLALDEKTHKLYLPAAELGPVPAPTTQQPHSRPAILPRSFRVVIVGR